MRIVDKLERVVGLVENRDKDATIRNVTDGLAADMHADGNDQVG